ncbi:MAG: hypothetical protein HOP07_07375 [Bacteriovoracaceae bacterium]|nr:hypothetical protein [Bacteriovoracaceae bacterium]
MLLRFKSIDGKTRAKKDELLLVLEFPTIPLHNNTSELAMREKLFKEKSEDILEA